MVIDSTMKLGTNNTVMSTGLDVYLPRLKSTILNTVNTPTTTTITASADGAPNLTPTQRQNLNVAVAPDSLIGSNGQKLTTGQVGISTVPPELVRDMLP